ncbi:NAD(+) synthase [Candidatus Uhrbacteria bacterium]|nr:NAD(+) synthase [Candidatus Uhrbacteria bacterium]
MLHPDLVKYFPGPPPTKIAKIELTYKKPIDESVVLRLVDALHSFLKKAEVIRINSLIVGLSGGIDSAVSCALLKQAFGSSAKCIIVEFDQVDQYSQDTLFSIELAKKIGIEYEVVNAYALYQAHLNLFEQNTLVSKMHLRSRLVRNIVFQFAENVSAMVIDTTDKSEDILKMYEESFKGHIAPLTEFYKSELYDMVDYFGLPELKAKDSGCPDLFDFDAYGLDWETLDPILHLLVEKGLSPNEIEKAHGIDLGWLQSLQRRITTQPLRTTTARL